MRRRGVAFVVVAITLLAAIPASASAATFSNPTPIAVPDEDQAPPSPVSVDGLSGTVTKVRATLNAVTSDQFGDDLDVLLVGPAGQSTILMSDVCFTGNNVPSAFTLTFDDEAASPVPELGPCVSGTYRPANFDQGDADAFISGAPSGPYQAALSVLTGTSPNGTWQLFTADDESFGGGLQNITGGWSLELAAGSCSGLSATVPAHVGTAADDTITGTPGPDVILGLGGEDTIRGLSGKDTICGGQKKDTLRGGSGKDKLLGQGGSDKLSGGSGKDVCKGGKKDDTAKKCEVEKSI
jgi:Ca2+-binding RTX toxin-like protein